MNYHQNLLNKIPQEFTTQTTAKATQKVPQSSTKKYHKKCHKNTTKKYYKSTTKNTTKSTTKNTTKNCHKKYHKKSTTRIYYKKYHKNTINITPKLTHFCGIIFVWEFCGNFVGFWTPLNPTKILQNYHKKIQQKCGNFVVNFVVFFLVGEHYACSNEETFLQDFQRV